jgi:hypothetical protein
VAGMYELQLKNVNIINGTVSIYLQHTEQFLAHSTEQDRLAHVNAQSAGTQFSQENLTCSISNQVTALAKQFSTVKKVKLYINGELISEA